MPFRNYIQDTRGDYSSLYAGDTIALRSSDGERRAATGSHDRFGARRQRPRASRSARRVAGRRRAGRQERRRVERVDAAHRRHVRARQQAQDAAARQLRGVCEPVERHDRQRGLGGGLRVRVLSRGRREPQLRTSSQRAGAAARDRRRQPGESARGRQRHRAEPQRAAHARDRRRHRSRADAQLRSLRLLYVAALQQRDLAAHAAAGARRDDRGLPARRQHRRHAARRYARERTVLRVDRGGRAGRRRHSSPRTATGTTGPSRGWRCRPPSACRTGGWLASATRGTTSASISTIRRRRSSIRHRRRSIRKSTAGWSRARRQGAASRRSISRRRSTSSSRTGITRDRGASTSARTSCSGKGSARCSTPTTWRPTTPSARARTSWSSPTWTSIVCRP